jgi:dephospho-CoA kinase
MDFARLVLTDWQQFAEVDISFHPRATIITGANGCGKTTILSLLAKQLGWSQISLATPKTDLITKGLKYFSLIRNFGKGANTDREIGRITYTNNSVARLLVPEAGGPQYNIEIHDQQPARFFYIPSHRQTWRSQGASATVS